MVTVTKNTVIESKLLTGIMHDMHDMHDCETLSLVPLANVASEHLLKIMEFCEKKAEYDKKMKDNEEYKSAQVKITRDYECWQETFLEGMQDHVPALMAAANYMDMECVLQACSTNITEFIKKRTPEEIRTYFKVKKSRQSN